MSNNYYELLQALQVGDEVIYYHDHVLNNHTSIEKVTKVTATQITVDQKRFSKRNGLEMGRGDRWHWDSITPLTEENRADAMEEMRKEAEQKRKQEIAHILRNINPNNFNLDILERIMKIIKEDSNHQE